MHRGKPVVIALDSEFLKTHGHVLTRAVAFVPFSARKGTSGSEHQFDGSVVATSTSLHSSLSPSLPVPKRQAFRRATVFGVPIILNLDPVEVMRRADVLPCGHSLALELRTGLVSGERLRTLQERHARSDSKAFLRRTEEATTTTTTTTTFSGNRAWHLEFNSLCPYSIPNIRRADHSWFKAIYSASVHSSEFRGAAMCLDHLKTYGKGRRQERSLSFLLRHHPTLLQEILRVSFSSAEAWCAWLVMCGDLVEKELRQLAEKYRQMSSSPFTPSILMEYDPSYKGVQYKECGNMEEFSYELSRLWYILLRHGGEVGTKLYTYGDMDAKAIQNTLRLSCCMKTRYSPRASQSARLCSPPSQLTGADEASNNKSDSQHVLNPLQPESGQLLTSPYEAKVVDVTRHTLFAASGFRTSPRVIPPLGDALEKAAIVDEAAVRLRSQSDPHNPVWDAKALACITVACGICLG
ncbi:hypothetical protein TcCL_ESM09546 [Trypanosoma cruzi]|uniref:Uncharacterized protein n=1 Tax=Trypanosoma cruzi (strain CL Brener) TaxID=353153 RepID=Q4CRR0_TRYCC|nr:hypothetical protein, conserved [Trypanosoma cruzi]EAN82963.1 hypothetical protein, conserved [Trypanosoma cruzi]RNC53160.1 hypothetical protein TcCL_ESM09546 [Trypanosoma cruzi]|eukprot:XP_804814.1 hypothetical protein [Trypanosoma cruzi strain CL Brener]